jgi:hypothetical protein
MSDGKTYRQPRQEIASTGKQPSRFLPTGPAEEVHDLIDQFWSGDTQPDQHYAAGTPNMVEVKQEATSGGVIAVGESWHGVKCTAHNEDGSHSYEVSCGVELCENVMRWSQWGDVLTFLYSRNWIPTDMDKDGEPTGDLWTCPGHKFSAERKAR